MASNQSFVHDSIEEPLNTPTEVDSEDYINWRAQQWEEDEDVDSQAVSNRL